MELPLEIICHILSFYPILRYRNGKWINQIAPEKKEIIYSIPKIIYYEHEFKPTLEFSIDEARIMEGNPYSLYVRLYQEETSDYKIRLSKTVYRVWTQIDYRYHKVNSTSHEETKISFLYKNVTWWSKNTFPITS